MKPPRRNEDYWLKAAALRFAKAGYRLFRNNVGLFRTLDGRKTRSGLAAGSADHIGWRSVVIQPGDVGRRVAIFVAVEVKADGNRPSEAQRRFLDAVAAAGGEAWLVTGDRDEKWGGTQDA